MDHIPEHYKDYIEYVLVSHSSILHRVDELAEQIIEDNRNRELVIVCVLKGAYRFSNDLINALYRANTHHPIRVEFIRASSYTNTKSNSAVQLDVDIECRDKNVIICEDIIDTGHTMRAILERFNAMSARSVSVASLFLKKDTDNSYRPDYIGFEVENKFIIGYGIDYNEVFRDLDHVCVINNRGIEAFRV